MYQEALQLGISQRNRSIVKQVTDNCKNFRETIKTRFNDIRDEEDN